MHMQRANELMAAFGQTKDKTFMERIEGLNGQNRDSILKQRKLYLVKVIEHLLRAADHCQGEPLKIWASHSFAAPSEPVTPELDDIGSFRTFADVVHGSVEDPRKTRWWGNGGSLTTITKSIIHKMTRFWTRRRYDNICEENRDDVNHKFYKFEQYTAIEERVAEILILSLSVFMLSAQHKEIECHCTELPKTHFLNEPPWWGASEEQLYFHYDKAHSDHECNHVRRFNTMLYNLITNHMEHVDIEEVPDGESLYQIDRDKFHPFEFTRFLSALAAFLSDRVDKAYTMDDYYVFDRDKPPKKLYTFISFARDRQERMPKPKSKEDWEKSDKDSIRCLRIVSDLAMAMYYLRFFLRGHEGSVRLLKISQDEGRRMGTLNFHELREADAKDTAAGRIYSDLVRTTKGMFDRKKSGEITCEKAQKIAEHINKCITDKVQNKLMTDITMWTLVFGSCLDAYGLLDEVKSESELWETVKGELQSTQYKSTASRTSGTWTCK